MNEKLKYAPGKPGFGNKGEKGLDGQQGLSMYFTNYEGITAGDYRIKTRISANEDLWAPPGGNPLPDGRIYVAGDLFVDNEGKVYEINPSTVDKFVYTYANINLGGFFTPLGASSSEGYQRYFNSNVGQKYIIDNVHTVSGAIDYTNSPADIYGIDPINFTRIEFTDVKQNGNLNAFTTYTINSANDKNALAIVFHEASSNFRIGNLDANGKVRDTNLIFDVSNLMVYKDADNGIKVNSPAGTVLTNYEINANSIFDPNFDNSPISFGSVTGLNDCSIHWYIPDFGAGDPNLKAELVFYEKLLNINTTTFRTDSSAARPLVFSNLDASGSINIRGLKLTSATPYEYYMKLIKNGWNRISDYGTIFAGTLTISPSPLTLDSSIAYPTSTIGFDVRSNISWNNPVVISNPSSFLSFDSRTDAGYDGSIYFSATANPGRGRTGIFRITPFAGVPKDVSVWQPGAIIDVLMSLNNYSPVEDIQDKWVTVQADSSLFANNLPVTSTVDVSINVRLQVVNNGESMEFWPNGNVIVYDNTGAEIPGAKAEWPADSIYITPSITNYVDDKYIRITNVPQTSFPLKLKVFAEVVWVDEIGATGFHLVSITARSIRAYKNSGGEIYITQTGLSTKATAEIQ